MPGKDAASVRLRITPLGKAVAEGYDAINAVADCANRAERKLSAAHAELQRLRGENARLQSENARHRQAAAVPCIRCGHTAISNC